MGQIEYTGITADGVKVVVRKDATHYRAYAMGAAKGEEKPIGTPKVKFSDLSAELGLRMDGSRPETLVPPTAEPTPKEPGAQHIAKTRGGIDVIIDWTGTHWVAKDSTGQQVGNPKILLRDLGMELGLVFQGGHGEPGEADLTNPPVSPLAKGGINKGDGEAAVRALGGERTYPYVGMDAGAEKMSEGAETRGDGAEEDRPTGPAVPDIPGDQQDNNKPELKGDAAQGVPADEDLAKDEILDEAGHAQGDPEADAVPERR